MQTLTSGEVEVRRELILDTETTGIDPDEGHRIIELAAVERVDGQETGAVLHVYLDPQRPVEPGAVELHGMTWASLAACPTWPEVEHRVLEWLQGAHLVAHYAPFDLDHIAAEVRRSGRYDAGRADAPATGDSWRIGVPAQVVCTRHLARQVLPDLPSRRLDALLDHYGIDRTERDVHGHSALLDCRLLAQVYDQLLAEPAATTTEA